MRFTSDGPSIPDELLTARDAGQVLFFCGAGVSLARAKLPDFITLAEQVMDILGSGLDSRARGLFNEAKGPPRKSIATDRIFGFLEREFDPSDVQEAVATALRPPSDVCLDAHKVVLDLSRDKTGIPRLVTTNFDTLFEACEPGVGSSNPPKLPDPLRAKDFHGIVHLHGCVDEGYRGARDGEFVLSSADFGQAYLADGWASRYIQSLLQRFRIVFLGYSADDPPVQYLLEALNRFPKPAKSLYAFQSGNAADALAQWAHKGVTPIPYDSARHHAALWESLSAWAERARDVGGWHKNIIRSAIERGPAEMTDHERGMVAHIFSTEAGAKFIAASEPPLPATWLSVIDSKLRYATPRLWASHTESKDRFDPFDIYGLDSDEPPAPIELSNHYATRKVPEGAWNALDSQNSDYPDGPQSSETRLPGITAHAVCDLPARLIHIGTWLVSVSDQPAMLWWAARNSTLHPRVLEWIERRLLIANTFTPTLRAAWRLVIKCMRDRPQPADYQFHKIATQAKAEGWSQHLVREALAVCTPKLVIEASFNDLMPQPDIGLDLDALVRFDVEYPRPQLDMEIPQEYLAYGVRKFRHLLEDGLELERLVTGGETPYFDTIRADDGKALPNDTHGLTGHLYLFTKLVLRLAEYDPKAARLEVAQWSQDQHQVFIRLKIWAAGIAELTSPEQAGQTMIDLDSETFWSSRQERDLLFSMRDRWSELPKALARQIEARLLTGEIPWLKGQADEAGGEAHERLNRLQWLSSRGVKFSFDYDVAVASLRRIAPQWTEESVRYTALPQVSEAFSVTTDPDSTAIEQLPLGEVLAKVRELSGDDVFARIRRDPFLGLAQSRPARALSVLTLAGKADSFPASAWWTLVSTQAEGSPSRRLMKAMANRLARLRVENLAEILHPVSTWMHNDYQRLQSECPMAFEPLWDSTLAALRYAKRSELRGAHSPRRWVDEGLNSAAGRLALAQREQLKEIAVLDEGLPVVWRRRTEELLSLPQDHRNHVIAMLAADLGWLYQTDSEWTTEHLLSILLKDNAEEVEAFWAGFLWTASGVNSSLFPHLKAGLIALAMKPDLAGRDRIKSVAGLLLAKWGNCRWFNEDPPQFSDAELREVLIQAGDAFRIQILWYLEHWCKETQSENVKHAKWSELLIPFLTKVWPKQLVARTESTSGRLLGLALAFPDRFLEIIGVIQRQLVVADNFFIGPFGEKHVQIAVKHPLELLAVLSVSLGEDPTTWPFETGKLLATLAEQPLTKADPRLGMLRERELRHVR
jgi:SIR2-like domain